MKRSVFNYCFIALLSIISCGCFSQYINRNIREGNIIVNKIEKYKDIHGTLPDKLQDVGQSDYVGDVLFCYEKESDTTYVVWFGTTLGEGMYYYSDTKRWTDQLH